MRASFGTGAIVCLVDNDQKSRLVISDCEIETRATMGVSVRSLNSELPDPGRPPHAIRKCRIKGREGGDKANTKHGTFSAVNLGAFAPHLTPIDMRGSLFEVSGCHLDSARFAGIVALIFLSDAASRFRLTGNTIGYDSAGAGEATSHGIVVSKGGKGQYFSGALDISGNRIRMGRYHRNLPQAAGIQVEFGSADERLAISIARNRIHACLPPTRLPDVSSDGIVYEDKAGCPGAKGKILDNQISSGSDAPLLRGLRLAGPLDYVHVGRNDLRKLAGAFMSLSNPGVAVSCRRRIAPAFAPRSRRGRP